jgi:DNA polymerase-3 subunit alpha
MCDFVHLHCHTQFSLLDGASDISMMMDKAVQDGQKAVALTDHGNMYGAFKFVSEANKRNIKPIIGCEFYLVENRHIRSFKRSEGEYDDRFHQLILAKNEKGYQNLSKLCSLGFIEGSYGKYPRIDKELIEKYHEGLIATSCCLAAEIPQAIIRGDLDKAEKKLKWWLNIFGEDFYIELMRHRGLEDIDYINSQGQRQRSGLSQEDVNQQLIKLAVKYNVRTIATNDAHYVDEQDAPVHDILLCVNTGTTIQQPDRFKFPSTDFFFRTQSQMASLFSDVPEAIANTIEIMDKVQPLSLARDVLLPAFPLPQDFKDQQSYLRHLTFQGAQRRYNSLSPEIEERLNYELQVIEQSGYPGYFLIVQDFTATARKLGVSVGPGRGSAAGSAVAYCLGITNVDPIKYDLLFERFLNPERISMPDIDIDFDDQGRQKVIDYVVDKYGKDQVAQIITYSSMGAKSALRDVGRVMDIPLNDVNEVVKQFPEQLGASLNDVLFEGGVKEKLAKKLNQEDTIKANSFRKLSVQANALGAMIEKAKKLEGSIRNTGIHACGIVITPGEISKYVPVKTDKTTSLLISQFDNDVAENAGLLKMDFLGLKTLSIIKNAVRIVEKTKGDQIDIENISLEDEKTYELFQAGATVGIFQYESKGMQSHLKALKPSKFEDLIAMNALYRPGPMEYIPNFVNRKFGKEEVKYDLPEMEEILQETYGITVYQEQVMLLSQKLAGFTKGQADMLRKGMGKKKKKLIDQLYPKFIEGGKDRGHDKKVLDKIWKDWESFAQYAFNKSHSTCYALIAFQTAYLKAHYPAAFMAAVLTNSKNDISKLSFFLDECNRMGIKVLPPSVNESLSDFTVTADNQIRFGLTAIKGVGQGAVEDIIKERKKGGHYGDIFDFVTRISNSQVNKKALESLAFGGGLDCFNLNRSAYFAPSDKYDSFLAHLVKYGQAYVRNKAEMQNSLFGNIEEVQIPQPTVPNVEEWAKSTRLKREKDVIGIFASGHPLDDYAFEMNHLITTTLDRFDDVKEDKRKVTIAGIVGNVRRGENQRGNGYCRFDLIDYKGIENIGLFRESFNSFQHLAIDGAAIYIKGIFSKHYKSGNIYFNALDVGLLESLGDRQTKGITLGLKLNGLVRDRLQVLKDLIAQHEGEQTLSIQFYDSENKIKLLMESSDHKVKVCTELIQAIEKLDLRYKLN